MARIREVPMSDSPPEHSTRQRGFELARDLLGFQLKLLIDALRDLVTSPIALAAALLDLLLIRQQSPRHFRSVLRLGKRSEDWIDLWSSAYDEHTRPENVDAVLDSVQQLLRDPRLGARKARVLRRWAERQMRQRRVAAPPSSDARPEQ